MLKILTAVLLCACLLAGTAIAQEAGLSDLAGNPVQLSSFKGKPVILFFWTTWCPFCREELKKLDKQYPQMEQAGIVVLAINVKEDSQKVQRYMKKFDLKFKVLLDKSARLANKYELIGVPTFIFLDKEGKELAQEHELTANYRKYFKQETK